MSRFNNLPRNLREVTRNQDAVYKLPYEGKRSNLACVNEFFVRLCCVRIKWNYRGLVVYYLLGVEEEGGGRPFLESLFKVVLKDQHLYFSRLSPQTIARTIVLYHRKYYWLFIFHAKLSTINEYLLFFDSLYSLQLWSEQTRQMNRRRLQKLCKPMFRLSVPARVWQNLWYTTISMPFAKSKVAKVQIPLTFAGWNKLRFRGLYKNTKFQLISGQQSSFKRKQKP